MVKEGPEDGLPDRIVAPRYPSKDEGWATRRKSGLGTREGVGCSCLSTKRRVDGLIVAEF